MATNGRRLDSDWWALALGVIVLVLIGLFSGLIRAKTAPHCIEKYCITDRGIERAE